MKLRVMIGSFTGKGGQCAHRFQYRQPVSFVPKKAYGDLLTLPGWRTLLPDR
jgi:hypothetical protein